MNTHTSTKSPDPEITVADLGGQFYAVEGYTISNDANVSKYNSVKSDDTGVRAVESDFSVTLHIYGRVRRMHNMEPVYLHGDERMVELEGAYCDHFEYEMTQEYPKTHMQLGALGIHHRKRY